MSERSEKRVMRTVVSGWLKECRKTVNGEWYKSSSGNGEVAKERIVMLECGHTMWNGFANVRVPIRKACMHCGRNGNRRRRR